MKKEKSKLYRKVNTKAIGIHHNLVEILEIQEIKSEKH
jgi:hypothetical protein